MGGVGTGGEVGAGGVVGAGVGTTGVTGRFTPTLIEGGTVSDVGVELDSSGSINFDQVLVFLLDLHYDARLLPAVWVVTALVLNEHMIPSHHSPEEEVSLSPQTTSHDS